MHGGRIVADGVICAAVTTARAYLTAAFVYTSTRATSFVYAGRPDLPWQRPQRKRRGGVGGQGTAASSNPSTGSGEMIFHMV